MVRAGLTPKITIIEQNLSSLEGKVNNQENLINALTKTPEHIQVSLTEAKDGIRSLEQKVAENTTTNGNLFKKLQNGIEEMSKERKQDKMLTEKESRLTLARE